MPFLNPRKSPLVPAQLVLTDNSTMRAGFLAACICGVLGLATISFASPDALPFFAIVTLFVIPFWLGLLLTGNFTNTLTLVWINEIFFGGTGHWLELGPVPARWLLLLILIFLGGAQTLISDSSRHLSREHSRPIFSAAIVFFGAFLPLWLVFYSAVFKDTPFWTAIGDVNYLFALLAYFALRGLLKRHFDLLRAWIIGGVFVLALFFSIMSLAPAQFVNPIFTTISGVDSLGTTDSGINRAAMVFQILLLIGVYLGILYAIDKTQLKSNRLAGALYFALSISSYVFMFLRGPLLSISVVAILFTVAVAHHRKLRWWTVRLFAMLALIGACAFALYSTAVPEAIEKFTLGAGFFSSFVDEVRIEQADRMLSAFAQSPILGQGVGVPIWATPEAVMQGCSLNSSII